MTFPPVTLVEVSPRDGLQNEPEILSTGQKVELIERALAAGLRRIEAVSFVNPRRVPQMADAEAVMKAVPRRPGVTYSGLALNVRGAQRAVDAGVDEINYVVVSTDSYNQANQGCPSDETLRGWGQVATLARDAGLRATLTVAASFGCPFEGEVDVDRVVHIARQAAAEGADEIILADSIGVASPADVLQRVDAVQQALPDAALRCHFHNTRNTGIANVLAAMQAGVRVFDASIGGIGGCPFAPGATGNIPTEDVAYMLERMRCAGSVSAAALADAAQWLAQTLGRPVPGMLSRAGLFPRPAAAACA
ncbi:hydroxymethylglutaryl-CoA lyase [Bordetella petrii]|uniref:Hydroxymethylglutaryl-CoA lyase n=1 Tax=Bordetella petrii (strain ATCC BAA-461 / DSM 12804 / CCUG 43448 / CIP 107267 / Se-1111R) TaxID=340100 RepID=A9IR28_BORPD|nr:hydroxymethylglutaryl-CoA lyase [Bordetella petrii]CAP43125.1 hydroxymethylglutaryl-CoA lyase [Bordetella petrii]